MTRLLHNDIGAIDGKPGLFDVEEREEKLTKM